MEVLAAVERVQDPEGAVVPNNVSECALRSLVEEILLPISETGLNSQHLHHIPVHLTVASMTAIRSLVRMKELLSNHRESSVSGAQPQLQPHQSPYCSKIVSIKMKQVMTTSCLAQ